MFCHVDKKQPNFTKINMTNISGIFTQSYSRAKVYYLQLVWSVVRKTRSFSLYEFSFEMPGVGLLWYKIGFFRFQNNQTDQQYKIYSPLS